MDTNNQIAVKIHSLWTKEVERSVAPSYTVTVPRGATILETLENVFVATNIDSRPRGNEFCSTSSGDILEVQGAFFLVEGVGYSSLTTSQAMTLIEFHTSRDSGLGLDWLIKRGILQPSQANATLGQ